MVGALAIWQVVTFSVNTHMFSSCFDVVSRSHVIGAVRNGCSGLPLLWLGHRIDCGVKKTCEGYGRCTAVLLSKSLYAPTSALSAMREPFWERSGATSTWSWGC